MKAEDVRALVLEHTRPSVRSAIVAICLAITVIDGFDILSIAFVAPIIARQWGLDPVQLGIVFSSGLAGMAVGALAISPLGDILGRRSAIIINLLLIGGGMLLTATATTVPALAGFRFVTGLGIGAMMSNTGTLIMEYVPAEKRTSALGLMLVGNPVGNLISGLVTLTVVGIAGWQAVFLCGGALTLAMIVLTYFGMPESVDYLLQRRPKNLLQRLNRVLRQLGVAQLTGVPAMGPRDEHRTRLVDVFRGSLLRQTILIGVVQFIFMFAYYIFVNWSPKLITDMGASVTAGVTITMLINLGGIGGPLLVGFITTRLGLIRVTSFGYVAIGLSLAAFGIAPQWLWLLGVIAVIAGFSMFGTQVPLYSLVAGSYPVEVRATAVGLSFAIGRIGSVLGPGIAGVLLQNGLGRAGLFAVAALPMLAAAAMVPRIPKENMPRPKSLGVSQ